MNAEYLKQSHYSIMLGRHKDLKKFYYDYRTKNKHLTDDHYVHTFRLLFTNACNQGKYESAKWLYDELFKKFSAPTQSGIRHVFNYCLAQSRRNPRFSRLTNWLQRIVIELRDKFGVKR